MDFPYKLNIEIDMLDFLKTGKFDCLALGQTNEWIYHNFPNPDDYTGKHFLPLLPQTIWLYGMFELHFFDGKLQMIFSDHFQHDIYGHSLNAGEHIRVKPWIFKHKKKLTLAYVMRKLTNEGIDFEKITTKWHICLKLQSNVKLLFDNNGNKNLKATDYLMMAFSLSTFNTLRDR